MITRKSKLIAAILAGFGACGSIAWASGSSAPVKQGADIVGGTSVTTDPAVVLFLATLANGKGSGVCTAEIVSPHVVMTAAHCVDPDVVGQVSSFDIFLGDDVTGPEAQIASNWLHVSETHFNPNFDSTALTNGQDIAVAILAKGTSITPIKLNHTAMDATQVGAAVRVVGYGITAASDSTGMTAGIKRQTTTPLTNFDDNFVEFGDADKDTCEGDSGGPAFMTVNGEEVIAGITSFGDIGCVSGSWDTRIDTVAAPFVDPYIDQFDGTGAGKDGGSSNATSDGGTSTETPDMAGPTTTVVAMPVQGSTAGKSGGCSMAPGASAPASAGWLFTAMLLALGASRRLFSGKRKTA